MKKVILFLATILATLFAKSQDISGQWSGKLDMHGREVNVVFDIKKSGNTYKVTMHNAEQAKKGYRQIRFRFPIHS
jgi:hypothetical protein